MPLEFKDPAVFDGYTSGFLSKHLGTSRKYNETNGGLGLTTKDGYLLGAYMNSLNKPSMYAAKEWKTDPYQLGPVGLQAGLLGGVVTGYPKPLLPLLMPEVLASMGDHSLALGLVPPMKNVAPAVMALQYRKKF